MSLEKIVKIGNYYNLKYNLKKISSNIQMKEKVEKIIKIIINSLKKPSNYFFSQENLKNIQKIRKEFEYHGNIEIYGLLRKDGKFSLGIISDNQNFSNELLKVINPKAKELVLKNLNGIDFPKEYPLDLIKIDLEKISEMV
jgi:hypothetical protein